MGNREIIADLERSRDFHIQRTGNLERTIRLAIRELKNNHLGKVIEMLEEGLKPPPSSTQEG